MRRTLSQLALREIPSIDRLRLTYSSADRDAWADRPARWLLLVLCLSLAGLAGCNEVNTAETSSADVGTPGQSSPQETAAKPPFSWPIDPSHPVLEIRVEAPEAEGRIRIELMPELAPATVVSVIELANEGFYDGTTFHRVIPGFMIQGGDPKSRDRDPSNDGQGAPGRPLHDEFGDAPFLRGVVGMGNKGRADSTSTQFFIMHGDNPNLEGRYTAIGRVLSGMEIVDAITESAIDRTGRWGPKDRPIENVVMSRVRTIGPIAQLEVQSDPAASISAESKAPTNTPPASDHSGADVPAAPAPAGPDDWERLEALGR